MTDVRAFGVIGEDETDCATLKVLIQRLAGTPTRVRGRHGNGGSEIFKKASA